MSKPEGQREMGSEGIEVSAVSSRTGGVVRGSTLLVGGLLVVIAVVIVWLGLTGRLSDLRHANLPFHPYPPSGYTINPFDPGNKDDLINVTEANTVKADLLADGKVELAALQAGDSSQLSQADTGNRLQKESEAVAANNTQGVSERIAVDMGSISVGYLADPNDDSVRWCVQEKGTAQLQVLKKIDGSVVSTRRFSFDDKFWMRRVGGQYLIVDALVNTSP
jgi:hypothetical protein